MAIRSGNDLASDIYRGMHPDVREFDPMLLMAILSILIELSKCWMARRENDTRRLQRASRKTGLAAHAYDRWLYRAVRRAAGGRVRFEELGGAKLAIEIKRVIMEASAEDARDTITHLAGPI